VKDGIARNAILREFVEFLKWKVIKVNGGELGSGKVEMPRSRSRRRKESSIATYFLVVILLTILLVLFAPNQFAQFVHALTGLYPQIGEVLIVLIIIALITYVLGKRGKL